MSNSKEGVMAAIMAVVDQLQKEELLTPAAVAKPSYGMSPWKYAGLQEMMNMRILWQLRLGTSATALVHLKRRP